MILISNDFWHKRKIYNFEPYNVLLTIDSALWLAEYLKHETDVLQLLPYLETHSFSKTAILKL